MIRYNTHLGFMMGGIHVFIEEEKGYDQRGENATEYSGFEMCEDVEAQAMVTESREASSKS